METYNESNMIYLFFILVLAILLFKYFMYLRMFKYAFLLMCANDKNAISNLLKKSNPFVTSLINRDIPLSIYLNKKKTYSKFITSNSSFERIDDFLSKYTNNSDYEYMQEIETIIESKLNEWIELKNQTKLRKKYFFKFYYLKTAIIIRLFWAFNNIRFNPSLENWKEELINYNDFETDILMQKIYFSICNDEISKNKMSLIQNDEPSSIEIENYIKNVRQTDLEGYACYSYWQKNKNLFKQKR